MSCLAVAPCSEQAHPQALTEDDGEKDGRVLEPGNRAGVLIHRLLRNSEVIMCANILISDLFPPSIFVIFFVEFQRY